MKNKKGFTIIEFVTVICILGILFSLTVPKFFSLQKQAREEVAHEKSLTEGYDDAYSNFKFRVEQVNPDGIVINKWYGDRYSSLRDGALILWNRDKIEIRASGPNYRLVNNKEK